MVRRRTLWIALGALSLLGIGLLARVLDLDAYLNLDAAHGWHPRTRGFHQALERGDPAGTWQKHHPGVTLMWLSGWAMQWGPGLMRQPGAAQVAAGALPVALWGALIAPLTFVLWRRWLGGRHTLVAWIAGLLIATEPFLVAHSRVMHLDMLLSGTLWIAALCAGVCLRRDRLGYAVACGALLGLAVLTKVTAGAVAVGIAGWVAWVAVTSGDRQRLLRLLGVLALITVVALLVTWLGWPALRDDWRGVLERMHAEGTRVVGEGHGIFFEGEVQRDPGILFYLTILMYRLSPELLVLLPLGLWWMLRRPVQRGLMSIRARRVPLRVATLGLLCAYGLLMLALMLGAKKIDRYLLPLMPAMALVSAYGVAALARGLARWPGPRKAAIRWPTAWTRAGRALVWTTVLAAGLLLWRGGRLIAVHPYPIAWTAGWRATPAEEAMQMGWCEGMREAALFIAEDVAGTPRPKGSTRPRVFSKLHHCLMPWLPHRPERSMRKAEYVVLYLSHRQRGWWEKELKRYAGRKLHTVRILGRVYAEIYEGPAYPKAEGSG